MCRSAARRSGSCPLTTGNTKAAPPRARHPGSVLVPYVPERDCRTTRINAHSAAAAPTKAIVGARGGGLSSARGVGRVPRAVARAPALVDIHKEHTKVFSRVEVERTPPMRDGKRARDRGADPLQRARMWTARAPAALSTAVGARVMAASIAAGYGSAIAHEGHNNLALRRKVVYADRPQPNFLTLKSSETRASLHVSPRGF